MYNPFAGWRVTGDWYDHRTYSEGGTDYPLPYGTALRAPAAGRLVNNGWAGTAGRRATLHLHTPVRRVLARSSTWMLGGYVEHPCDMVAIVFQHASGYLGDGSFGEGALLGFSGASANGQDWGGQVHLHIHGLCAHGTRVDYVKFLGAPYATVAAVTAAEIEEVIMAFDGIEIVKFTDTGNALYAVAENGRMEQINDIVVAQQIQAIKDGSFSGKFSRAQFNDVRAILKRLAGIPL